jgi:CheY-like chemotaxis protein
LDPRLLVVDDDAAVRESFVRLLRHYGYAAEESATGRDVLQQLRRHPFDLAVIDWRLTDMTGLDVAQAMQDDGVFTPWVLLSGYLDFEIARKAGALGAIKAVGYPVDLHAVVADALKEAAARAHGWSWFTEVPLTPSMTAFERWAALVIRVCGVKSDPATISIWASEVGASETKIYTTCDLVDVSARDSRDFARILRALRKNSGHVAMLEAHMVVAEPRTWRALVDRAGLSDKSAVISFDDFLRGQRFIPHKHLALVALKASILRR